MSSAQHKFTYRYSDDSKFPRPIIPIRLRHKENIIKPLTLIDSGADFSMFNAEFASILGIDLDTLEKTTLGGIAGEVTGYISHVEMAIHETFIPVPVVFSPNFFPFGFSGLLGQVGFFDEFKIEFDRASRLIVIK